MADRTHETALADAGREREVAQADAAARPSEPRARRVGRRLREGDARFNHHLRVLRVSAGVSARQVAEALGVSGRHLQLLERGEFRASAHQVLVCARLLDVSVGHFFEPLPGGAGDCASASSATRDAMISAFRKISNPDVQRCLLAFSRTLARSSRCRPSAGTDAP